MIEIIFFQIKEPLNPVIDENDAKVIKVKNDIQETFMALVDKLNNEKMQIFKMLDEIQYEKFVDIVFLKSFYKISFSHIFLNYILATNIKYSKTLCLN